MAGLFDRLQEDLDQREKMAGLTPADLLELPDDERKVVQTLARRGDLSLPELAEHIGRPEAEIAATLERLREKGFARALEIHGRTVYRTYFGRRRASGVMGGIWDKLAERTSGAEDDAEGSGETTDESSAEGPEGEARDDG